MRHIPLLLALVAVAFGQQVVPSIANVTNAALPALDLPPNSVVLAPGSLAIVFGTNLADSISSATLPLPTLLGGVEVHLVDDSCYDPTCELVADLIYTSPTQINFVVPDVPLWRGPNTAKIWNTRVVIIKDGQRFDDRTRELGGPGRVLIDAVYGHGDSAVFGVGYDCLYSFSLSDPGACGLSWSEGQHRAMLGAVTDAISGQLLTTQNPVHQGQLLTLWWTGLTGNPWFSNPTSFCFGVAQYGTDLPSGNGWCSGSTSPLMAGLWTGQSPQYPGLDQANVTFPICTSRALATSEQRYDVWLEFSGNPTDSNFSQGTIVRIYLPFVVAQGDSDCHDWFVKTPIATLQSGPNPSSVGQAVTFTATVSPSAATGTVMFFDGSTTLGSGTLNIGRATFTTSTLSVGSHSIVATYTGDAHYGTSSVTLIQTVQPPSITLTSTPNPSTFGGAATFTVKLSSSTATGTVTFSDGSTTLGSVTLSSGAATFTTSALSGGTHSIVATYNGNYGNLSATLTQMVTKSTITVVLTSNPNASLFGQMVTFTATVAPLAATGTVTFSIFPSQTNTIILSSTVVLNGGVASFSTSSLPAGKYTIGASYSGDQNHNSSGGSILNFTINKVPTTITIPASSLNPSITGQPVTFSATVSPLTATGLVTFRDYLVQLTTDRDACSGTLTDGQAKCIASSLPGLGVHMITGAYSGDSNYNPSTSIALSQTVRQMTALSLTSSSNPSVVGQAVTFTASIGATNATGTMTFYDGATSVGSASVRSSQTVFSTSGLSVGSHSITAVYSGDINLGGSTSGVLTQIVNAH
jgi:hypothetical protein